MLDTPGSNYAQAYAAWTADPEAWWAHAAEGVDWTSRWDRAFDPALGAFGQHNLPFGLPVILADLEMGHAVGLHPHHEVQPVGGDALEIGGEIIAGEGIVAAAIGGDGL